MKIYKGEYLFSKRVMHAVIGLSVGMAFSLALATTSHAGIFVPGGTNSISYKPLNSWSFNDTNAWTSDNGHSPMSFSNLLGWPYGNVASVSINSNAPAWLRYHIVEGDGTTNLTLNSGSVYFWYSPAWTSTNQNGAGPGEWARLLEVGGYAADASQGWWSVVVDDVGANLYFAVQPGDGTTTTYLQAPISWVSNNWHCVTLTYSATNTALYLDGTLATNGPGITAWPGASVQAGGFCVGSSSNGLLQAVGAIDDLRTYNVALDSNAVANLYYQFYSGYVLNPNNYRVIASAQASPATIGTNVYVFTGAGNLQWVGAASVSITNANTVWITNTMASVASDGSINLTFTIQGGSVGSAYNYDVFAAAALGSPMRNSGWQWMGQGTNSGIYTLNLSSPTAFLILGTPQDSDSDGLTDAYELLVSHTDPNNPNSNLDGISDGWEVLLGLNPTISNFTSASQRLNYGYTTTDWLNAISGVKAGSVTADNEGNVTTVSQ